MEKTRKHIAVMMPTLASLASLSITLKNVCVCVWVCVCGGEVSVHYFWVEQPQLNSFQKGTGKVHSDHMRSHKSSEDV